jgi:hypothetical protein
MKKKMTEDQKKLIAKAKRLLKSKPQTRVEEFIQTMLRFAVREFEKRYEKQS